jgi:hypothetical protein
VLAARLDQSIGNQDEGSVGEGDAFGPAPMGIQDGPEAQLIKEGADGQDRSPGRGIEDIEILGLSGFGGGGWTEQPLELGQLFPQRIFAAQLGNGALLDLAVETMGFDDPAVFVDRAIGGADFDGAEVVSSGESARKASSPQTWARVVLNDPCRSPAGFHAESRYRQ